MLITLTVVNDMQTLALVIIIFLCLWSILCFSVMLFIIFEEYILLNLNSKFNLMKCTVHWAGTLEHCLISCQLLKSGNISQVNEGKRLREEICLSEDEVWWIHDFMSNWNMQYLLLDQQLTLAISFIMAGGNFVFWN